MEIVEIEVGKLRPDPQQPRKSFNPDEVTELAQSFKTTGIINPIEIDKRNIIITGEYRWRAAKKAGLKTVPCKIISIAKEDRLIRQFVENEHHAKMSPWEVGQALKQLLQNGFIRRANKPQGGRPENGIKWLQEKTGKSVAFIEEHLDLIDKLSAPVQKAVKTGKLPISVTRAIIRAPKEHQKAMEKKVLAGEFVSHRAGLSVVSALQREQGNPEIVKKILKTDYSKFKSTEDVGLAVRKISPTLADTVAATFEPIKQLDLIVKELEKWLKENSKKSIGSIHVGVVAINLESAKDSINNWVNNK